MSFRPQSSTREHNMSHHYYAQWAQVPAGVWPGKHFTVQEFAQRGSGWHEGMTPVSWDDEFIKALDRLREAVGRPLKVSSGYRSPKYNKAVSTTGEAGPHTTGKAVDILCDGRLAHLVLTHALRLGFRGIGVSQKATTRFIHLDMITDPPRPNVWSY